MALLKVDTMCAYYDTMQVIFDLSFEVEAGQVCTILGANGAGKTTTLGAIVGDVDKIGRVEFDGQDISKLKTHKIVKAGLSYVPEMRGTFNELTVEDNLALGCYLRTDSQGIKDDLDMVHSYFPFLRDRLNQEAGTLSGGEQQMLAISRCLLMRPKMLMFDEPSLGLAPLIVKDIFKVMRRICDERGIGILVVEQNVNVALGIADKVFLLDIGKTVMSGTPEDFMSDASIQSTYLGMDTTH